MGLHYEDLHTADKRHLYKENTHVFAYYILSAIFLNNHQEFLLWCKKNNTHLLKFNGAFEAFGDYIAANYKCISLLNNLSQMDTLNKQVKKGKNKVLMNTTRMSIIHTSWYMIMDNDIKTFYYVYAKRNG